MTRAVNIPRANNCKDFGPSHPINHHHALSSRDSCQNHNGHSDYCSDIGIGGRHFNRCFSRRDSEETQECSRYTNQAVIRWVPGAILQITHAFSHLSKCRSDFKQKCTQLLKPFSGTVFHDLSHDMIHFVQSVSFKNHIDRGFRLAVEKYPPVKKRFLGLTLGTKRIISCERA